MTGVNELSSICSLPAEGLATADLSALYDHCLAPAQAFELPWAELGLVLVAAAAGIAIGIAAAVKRGAGAGAVVGCAIETCLYGAAGAYFGSTGGLVVAEFVPPLVLGIVGFGLALAIIAGCVLALVHGTAGAGMKVLGVLALLIFGGAFATAGVGTVLMEDGAGAASDYQAYLNGAALGLGFVGAANGLIVGGFRAVSPFTGWLIIPLVSAWGFLGTILGLLMHVASWLFFADFGRRNENCGGHCDIIRNWLGFVAYSDGFRVMPGYFFSQGGVMTADTKHGVWHEAVHVFQHIVFGPIFVVSYVGWLAVGAIVGLIAGAFKAIGPLYGAMAVAYVDNPWEVWEYMSTWSGVSSTPRQVPTGSAATNTSLVMSNAAGLGIGITYMVVCTGLVVLWVALRVAG